jgi:predicted GIY-YIG superfamily endonuclease
MLDERQFFVYILASRKHGTLYIGVTNSLLRRVHEHREGLLPGFTRKYGVKRLVYYETYQDVGDAIYRPLSEPLGVGSSPSFRRHASGQRPTAASSLANTATSAFIGPGFRRGDNREFVGAGETKLYFGAPMASNSLPTW